MNSSRYLVDQIREQYRSLGDEVALVLLHPRAPFRQALIDLALNDTTRRPLYCRIDAEDGSLEGFLASFQRYAVEQFGDSISLDAVSELSKPSPEEAAEACAEALSSIGPVSFIIDGLDMVGSGDSGAISPLEAFALKLVETMPPGSKLLISSRVLPRFPWVQLVGEGRVAVLGGEGVKEVRVEGEEVPPVIEVYAFGPGQVIVNGIPITDWEGELPRTLFMFLVDHPATTRQQVFDAFWPDTPTKDATNVFHVTKRKLQDVLGLNVIVYELGHYSLKPSVELIYDVALFEKYLDEAQLADADQPMELWLKAIDLYRGPFMLGTDKPWVIERRKELQERYAEVLGSVGLAYSARGEKELALGYLLRAVAEKPVREDLNREIIKLYVERGDIEAAKEHYRNFAEYLREELGIAPAPETARPLRDAGVEV